MNNMTKLKDEKKYAQISPETVLHLAESVGLANLSPSVARALSEDASYRCRELATLCGQFLRQSKRRKLTTQDVDRALKWYNAEPVYGHGAGSSECGYSRIVDTTKTIPGSSSLFVPDEKLIDLRPYALMQSPVILASRLTIQGSWLSLEGTYLPETDDNKVVEFPPPGSLTQPFIQLYSAIVNGVLNNSDQFFQKILDEVQTNSKLSLLLPYLVSFIRNGMQRHCDNQFLIRRLLFLLHALFSNPTLNLSPKPYLSHLVTALLSSLIIERPGRERNDFECLFNNNLDHMQQASQILRQALNHWATPVNQLRSQTHKALREYLRDNKISSSSHFGALSAMIALGPSVLEECLLPQMELYTNNLQEKLRILESQMHHHQSSSVMLDLEKKRTVLMILYGTLCVAARSIISSWINSDSDQEPAERKKRYETFVKYFGDSISCCATSSIPQSAPNEGLGKQASVIVSRLAVVRKLRNISGFVAPKKSTFQIKTESGIKMEVDDFNRTDFNLYTDMEMPTDIFEPERGLQPRTAASRPLAVLSEIATPLSPSVQAIFETNRIFSVNRNAKMSFALRGAWPTNRLKRKFIGAPRLGVGFRGYGVVGRRWSNTSLAEGRFSNSDYLSYIL